MNTEYATEASKTQLENIVSSLLSDKLSGTAMSIASKKYLTGDNQLVYLTLCMVPSATIPKLRVQLFNRVEGGVREESYSLYADHRFEKSVNEMIFGRRDQAAAPGEQPVPVSEKELGRILTLLAGLGPEHQTL